MTASKATRLVHAMTVNVSSVSRCPGLRNTIKYGVAANEDAT